MARSSEALPSETITLLYVDDQRQFMIKPFLLKMPQFTFINNKTEQKVTVKVVWFDLLSSLFKRREFLFPRTTRPFHGILMDEQLGPQNTPFDGGKVMKVIIEGTKNHPTLQKYGDLPGGYTGRNIVMYSTHSAYQEGEAAIEKHLKEIGAFQYIKTGFAKSPMSVETILPVLEHLLKPFDITVILTPTHKSEIVITNPSKGRPVVETKQSGLSDATTPTNTPSSVFSPLTTPSPFMSSPFMSSPFTVPSPFTSPFSSQDIFEPPLIRQTSQTPSSATPSLAPSSPPVSEPPSDSSEDSPKTPEKKSPSTPNVPSQSFSKLELSDDSPTLSATPSSPPTTPSSPLSSRSSPGTSGYFGTLGKPIKTTKNNNSSTMTTGPSKRKSSSPI